jgi:hypothetical protein
MSTLPVQNRLFGLQLALGVSLVATIIVIQISSLNDTREKLRSQQVATGLLDYGEKGKIIKSLGLVYGVREDGSRFVPYSPDNGRRSPFRKKRERGEYAYRANPGSGYQLPSTLAVGSEAFRNSWPLASLVIDRASLTDPLSGIAANPYPRGRQWERRATFSLFQQDVLAVAANVGVRIHGSDRDRAMARDGLDQSYRIYFRNYYGSDSVPSMQVFGDGETSVKRLVVRKGRPFVLDLAMDIAQRMGARVPYHTPAILYLNGENQRVYSLQEHVGRRQWELRIGHNDFFFVRRNGTDDESSVNAYRELSHWLNDEAQRLTVDRVSERVDLQSLTRDLFVLMFCGSNDRFEETAVLDHSGVEPRWQWITWELSDCFQQRWTPDNIKAWNPAALRQIVARDPQTGVWAATYRSIRSDLFARLLNNNPGFVRYFLRTVTDVFNHEATAAFLKQRHDFYEGMLKEFRDPLAEGHIEEFMVLKDYLLRRPDFIRDELVDAFSLKGLHTVSVMPPRHGAFTVDGYPKSGAYTGKYFTGQEVEAHLPEVPGSESVAWRVNGELVPGSSFSINVSSDLVIGFVQADTDN